MEGQTGVTYIDRRPNEKTELQDFLSAGLENITTDTGENNWHAAVQESKINLAQAGKIAGSWFSADCGLSLSWKSTAVDASAHI